MKTPPDAASQAGSTPVGSTPNIVLAIDPGKDKCGVAVVSQNGQTLFQRIALPSQVAELVRELCTEFSIFQIVLGNATTSRAMQEKLRAEFLQIAISEVEEKNSTLEARDLYWQKNPPRGWRRVLPLSAQVPPVPVDDFAAIVLARRFFQDQSKS